MSRHIELTKCDAEGVPYGVQSVTVHEPDRFGHCDVMVHLACRNMGVRFVSGVPGVPDNVVKAVIRKSRGCRDRELERLWEYANLAYEDSPYEFLRRT